MACYSDKDHPEYLIFIQIYESPEECTQNNDAAALAAISVHNYLGKNGELESDDDGSSCYSEIYGCAKIIPHPPKN